MENQPAEIAKREHYSGAVCPSGQIPFARVAAQPRTVFFYI